MLQPRQARKWSRSEKWILGASPGTSRFWLVEFWSAKSKDKCRAVQIEDRVCSFYRAHETKYSIGGPGGFGTAPYEF